MKTSLKLLSQMIEAAEADNLEAKKKKAREGAIMVGESWMFFHLKLLKEALEKENDET